MLNKPLKLLNNIFITYFTDNYAPSSFFIHVKRAETKMNGTMTYSRNSLAGIEYILVQEKYVADNLAVSDICVNTHTHILTTSL
ncbi:hypothetical protein Bache_0426 [Bacteroides helcogenes P 36-108]|uniref:Uncharacterized protein n=1 Tax=Bacteroides helcogenes (strain ATCC 35417 / DSM 20613 / JCM 6297 / CCUG 15421 / P 36-108) TaxID=693979 RepID=E6SVE3_BACT6|nr:hypothetical protein Bache_0426 [Bacteroides helcogenes P 36-108]